MKWLTQKRKVSELKNYDLNPRQITNEQFENLKKSIDEIGYAELIAIDTDNTIVAGHMRVKALISLGRIDEEIEIRVPERKLTEQEFKAYLIRSNKATGGWDWDSLANNFDNDDLLDWGFSMGELGLTDVKGKQEIDRDNMAEGLENYMNSDIKQVVLYFKGTEYEAIIQRLDALLQSTGAKDYSELALLMLSHYENNRA